jgi:predicted alpha/beta superfamily hydrolase
MVASGAGWDQNVMERKTERLLRTQLDIHYPPGRGRIVLRTELDWSRDVAPTAVSADGATSSFTIEARKPFLYFKPCLIGDRGDRRWAVGANMLALMTIDGDFHPHFDGSGSGSFSELLVQDSPILGRKHMVRVYLPAGYDENTLRRYPVLYMQDGKNLFFPEEAFLGHDWHVNEALSLLDAMNAVDRVIVIGVYTGDRVQEYTKPGYEAYARAVIEEIKPEVDRRLRVLTSPRETGVLGSSLGGVVSFYMAWEYPHIFGLAACMSSTFSYNDDLIERVLAEPKRESKIYLDSGWPGDNFEVTLAMAMALARCGYCVRQDFLHLVFPHEGHDEAAWGRRLHLPLQLGLGRSAAASRGRLI